MDVDDSSIRFEFLSRAPRLDMDVDDSFVLEFEIYSYDLFLSLLFSSSQFDRS